MGPTLSRGMPRADNAPGLQLPAEYRSRIQASFTTSVSEDTPAYTHDSYGDDSFSSDDSGGADDDVPGVAVHRESVRHASASQPQLRVALDAVANRAALHGSNASVGSDGGGRVDPRTVAAAKRGAGPAWHEEENEPSAASSAMSTPDYEPRGLEFRF
jgi:hypothetical protein